MVRENIGINAALAEQSNIHSGKMLSPEKLESDLVILWLNGRWHQDIFICVISSTILCDLYLFVTYSGHRYAQLKIASNLIEIF
jgi:hypothetical protein